MKSWKLIITLGLFKAVTNKFDYLFCVCHIALSILTDEVLCTVKGCKLISISRPHFWYENKNDKIAAVNKFSVKDWSLRFITHSWILDYYNTFSCHLFGKSLIIYWLAKSFVKGTKSLLLKYNDTIQFSEELSCLISVNHVS